MTKAISVAFRKYAISFGRSWGVWALVMACCVTHPSRLHAGPGPADRPGHEAYTAGAAAATPYTTTRVHRIGNIAFSVTNWRVFGSERRNTRDYCTRLPAESLEFPIGSGIDYLWAGSMWVGAVRGRDTLVSVGTNG